MTTNELKGMLDRYNNSTGGYFLNLINPNYGANLTNQYIGEKNLELQQETFNYNKELQQELFNREDSSYQRTVEDMRKAGISPLTLTGGTNSAGEAIAQTAPQNSYIAQPENTLQNLLSVLSTAQQITSGIYGIKKTMSDIAYTNEQTSFDKAMREYRIDEAKLNNFLNSKTAEKIANDNDILRSLGIRSNASSDEVKAAILNYIIKGKDENRGGVKFEWKGNHWTMLEGRQNGNYKEFNPAIPNVTEILKSIVDLVPNSKTKGKLEEILHSKLFEAIF